MDLLPWAILRVLGIHAKLLYKVYVQFAVIILQPLNYKSRFPQDRGYGVARRTDDVNAPGVQWEILLFDT